MSATYNMPIAIRMRGQVDRPALEKALVAVITRHEPLRTRMIAGSDGMPIGSLIEVPSTQNILIYSKLDFAADASEEERALITRQALLEQTSIPFDLSCELSLRAHLTEISASEIILTITLHHQAGDGASAIVLIRELCDSYIAFSNGKSPVWDPLPIQYSDWAAWQLASLSHDIDSKIARAKLRLSHAPESLTLPVDHPRDPNRARRAGHAPISISEPLMRALEFVARQEGTTLFVVMLAAYATFLGRLAGQQEVVVGSPVAGRSHVETENLVGFLVNTLALPVSLAGNCTTKELIGRTRLSVEEALIDQDLPFDRLVESLGVARSLSHTPVFQAMFALQPKTSVELNIPGIESNFEAVAPPNAKFDITLFLAPAEDGPCLGGFEYDANLFDAGVVRSWTQSFSALLSSFCDSPDQYIYELPLLNSKGISSQVALSRGPEVSSVEQPMSLPELFERTAQAHPDAVAIAYESTRLTYAELDSRSNQLAHHLFELGVGPDQIVAILLDRTPEMVIAILAVLKVGAAYLPLDPDYPAVRLEFMLSDSGANILVTTRQSYLALVQGIDEARTEGLEPVGGDAIPEFVLYLDDAQHQKMIEQLPTTMPSCLSSKHFIFPEHLAYLIYTSGSTGRPKGVGVSRRSQTQMVLEHQRQLDIRLGDRCLQVARPAFDVASAEIGMALVAGASIELLSVAESALVGPDFAQLCDRRRITHFMCVPNVLQLIPVHSRFSTVRCIVVGGEQCPPSIVARFAQDRVMINAYGPTETTVCATMSVPLDSERYKKKGADPLVPIGFPLANVQVYLLDQSLELVPSGVTGELYIAGVGLARGYLGRSGMTAERFLACPFGLSGERMYRTGDLARRRADGSIEFIGRVDDQIKIRGYRIELGEIEAALLDAFSEALSQATVIALPHLDEHRLIAYLVPQKGFAVPSSAVLRAKIESRLPDYMLPAGYVWLESLPLTPNGKLDHRALPKPELLTSGHAYRAPVTGTQAVICRLFAELTSTDAVGLDDNFFEIGGHSLLAMRLIARVRHETGADLPLRALFAHPTPEALAVQLDELESDQGPALLPGEGWF
jgi:nonribosomal peptide synthetase DhbF